jgi:hypothetical protein
MTWARTTLVKALEVKVAHKFKMILMIAVCAAIASLFTVSAAQCVDGATLDTYIALGSTGCSIGTGPGSLTFSNFFYSDSAVGAVPVPATAVAVDTLGPAGTMASILSPDLGFAFTAPWIANSSQSSDGAIFFTVSTGTGGPATIEDAALAQVSEVIPDGSGSVAEYGCTSSPNCNPSNHPAFVDMTFDGHASDPTSKTFDEKFFTATGSINVEKNITSTGGNVGFAKITIVQDTFSLVPEPRAISMLLGLCLVAGLALRKKFQSSLG